MQVPIDISLYPLNKEFILPIDDFIDNLKRYKNIEVQTNPISTQLVQILFYKKLSEFLLNIKE